MMILANTVAASHDCGIYRNLSHPDDDQLAILSQHIEDINVRRSDRGKQAYPLWDRYGYEGAVVWLQELLDASRFQDDQNQVRSLMIRSLPKARFGIESEGHFSLGMTSGNAFQDYTFFTSPIRRYSDLIVHRALKREFHIARDKHHVLPSATSTLEIENHLSSQSREAEKTQRDTSNLVAMHLLRHHVGQRRGGVVHEVKENGVVIELNDPPARGFLPVDSLCKHRTQTSENTIAAQFTHKRMKVGDDICVYIDKVDPTAGELLFSAIPVHKEITAPQEDTDQQYEIPALVG